MDLFLFLLKRKLFPFIFFLRSFLCVWNEMYANNVIDWKLRYIFFFSRVLFSFLKRKKSGLSMLVFLLLWFHKIILGLTAWLLMHVYSGFFLGICVNLSQRNENLFLLLIFFKWDVEFLFNLLFSKMKTFNNPFLFQMVYVVLFNFHKRLLGERPWQIWKYFFRRFIWDDW